MACKAKRTVFCLFLSVGIDRGEMKSLTEKFREENVLESIKKQQATFSLITNSDEICLTFHAKYGIQPQKIYQKCTFGVYSGVKVLGAKCVCGCLGMRVCAHACVWVWMCGCLHVSLSPAHEPMLRTICTYMLQTTCTRTHTLIGMRMHTQTRTRTQHTHTVTHTHANIHTHH